MYVWTLYTNLYYELYPMKLLPWMKKSNVGRAVCIIPALAGRKMSKRSGCFFLLLLIAPVFFSSSPPPPPPLMTPPADDERGSAVIGLPFGRLWVIRPLPSRNDDDDNDEEVVSGRPRALNGRSAPPLLLPLAAEEVSLTTPGAAPNLTEAAAALIGLSRPYE